MPPTTYFGTYFLQQLRRTTYIRAISCNLAAAAYPLEMLIWKEKQQQLTDCLFHVAAGRTHPRLQLFRAIVRCVESSDMPPNWLVATFGYCVAYFCNAIQQHPPTSTNNGKLFIKCLLLPLGSVSVLLTIAVWQVIWHARFYDVVTLLLT